MSSIGLGLLGGPGAAMGQPIILPTPGVGITTPGDLGPPALTEILYDPVTGDVIIVHHPPFIELPPIAGRIVGPKVPLFGPPIVKVIQPAVPPNQPGPRPTPVASGVNLIWSQSNGILGNTVTASTPQAIAVNDLLVVCAANIGGSITAVSDNKGNTFTKVVSETGGVNSVSIWAAEITTGGDNCVLTATGNGDSTGTSMISAEVSGIESGPANTNTNSESGTSFTPSTGSIDDAFSGMAFAMITNGQTSGLQESLGGWSVLGNDFFFCGSRALFRAVSLLNTVRASWLADGDRDYAACVALFRRS